MAKKFKLEKAQKLKAESLKKEFAVFGHFYDRKFNNEVIPCREILEIISLENVPYDFQVLPQAQAELIEMPFGVNFSGSPIFVTQPLL